MVSCARVGGGRSPTRSLLVLALFAAVACCSARKIFPGAGSTPRPNSGSIAAAVKGAGFAAAVEEAKTPEHDAAARDEDGDGKHHREDHSYHLDDSPYGHDYDGFNDFNVTQRLQEIFPLMDVDHDGHISKAELKQWHLEQGKNSSLRRAASEFETSDNDKDGYISLKEYLEEDFEARLDAEDGTDFDHMGDYNKKWIRNTRITFNLSDANHDGKLNADEFYMFLHPEESGAAAKLVQHLVQQDVNDHDRAGLRPGSPCGYTLCSGACPHRPHRRTSANPKPRTLNPKQQPNNRVNNDSRTHHPQALAFFTPSAPYTSEPMNPLALNPSLTPVDSYAVSPDSLSLQLHILKPIT